jgi:hypothetical protein
VGEEYDTSEKFYNQIEKELESTKVRGFWRDRSRQSVECADEGRSKCERMTLTSQKSNAEG